MGNTNMNMFTSEDGVPPVKYEIAFEKRPLLRDSNPSESDLGSSENDAYTGITEMLEDKIEWAPHVDEADKLDYIVAVSSGVIAGLIDTFYVGEFSLDKAKDWGTKHIEEIVMKVAHIEGYKGDDLKDAIKALENNHHLAADGNSNDFGSGRQHHFRDFSHHFGIGGLVFSIFTQFTGLVIGTDTTGRLIVRPVPESHKCYIGKNFHEKITFGTIEWFFHMVSDMAGSSDSLNGGTGIPGPLLSFMKELSALPFFKDSQAKGDGFRQWLSKLFNGTFLADHDEAGKIIKGTERRFDLRTEIGILSEGVKQVVPVIVNQCIVRAFYFVRRVCREFKELNIRNLSDLGKIAPEDVLPCGTPAMRRMVTVSSGVFVGVDFADAAVRCMFKKEKNTFFLRINYVGIATFVVSCVVDARAVLADRKASEGENPEDAFERSVAELGCLKLDFNQARILHSIERAIVVSDIEGEKHPKRAKRKRTWLNEWSEKVASAVGLVWAANAGYFLDDSALLNAIDAQLNNDRNDSWLWLIALESKCFTPYIPLNGKNDKTYKGLKHSNDCLANVFCKYQSIIDEKGLTALDKAMGKARGKLDSAATKRIVGAAGIVVVAAATGGLAFYFAPAIAPILAGALGAEAATLSGAALTSASLAFLGGGALAAGGAGMAGGTMLIAGGGALLGAIGSSGVSAATSMALATNSSYVLEECAKLIAFSEEVLLKRYGNMDSVIEIHEILNKRIMELEVEIEAIKRNISIKEISDEDDNVDSESNDASDTDNEISPKKMLKVLNQSLKYLKRSNDELAKVLKTA